VSLNFIADFLELISGCGIFNAYKPLDPAVGHLGEIRNRIIGQVGIGDINRGLVKPPDKGCPKTDWGEWLEIKESLALTIKDIVESAGTGFAFPSRSLYVESLPDAPDVFPLNEGEGIDE